MRNIVDSTTWNDYLKSALRAFRLSDFTLAEQRLDKAFASTKEDQPFLHILAGHIALARGSDIEAEKAWRKVLEIEPNNAEAWNNLGVLYRKKGENDKALDAFLEAQEHAPERPDIPYNIGNLHKTAGRFDEAVAAYNRALEINPEYTPAYNNLGTLYESRKQRDKAVEVFRRGLSSDAKDASLRFNMGLVYQEQSNWDEAKEAFDTALKSRPGWVPGLNNLGIVLQELGREDEAARTFRNLLDIEPDNLSALNNLGVAYDRLGRTDDARNCYKKALEEDPAYTKAALNLYNSYQENQELSEALEEINKQITHHPTDPDIRIRMARTLMGLARWAEAERSLDHVLERNLSHSGALRAKADLFLATSRPEEAEALLRKLPHDPDSVQALARLDIATNRIEDAQRLLEELVSADPNDAESRRLLSDLIAETDSEKALQLRKEATEADPGRTEDLIAIARLNEHLGRKDEALGNLDEAVNLLGSRGEADDLDSMNDVLSLYETAAAALEEEKSDLFTERTMQLGRKLQSAMGLPGASGDRGNRFLIEEIPLEEEDALSLLDINSMEPVIRINEEEETVFLEESTENLEDAYTELQRPEYEEPPRSGGGGQTGSPSPKESGLGESQGAPVHIHLSPPTAAASPQVIYQDVRPAPVQEPASLPGKEPEISVTDMPEENLPEFPETPDEREEKIPEEDTDDLSLNEEDLIEEDENEVTFEITETEEPVFEENVHEDDGGFLIPDSDALSEDLPEETILPESKVEQELILEAEPSEPENILLEDFDLETAPEEETTGPEMGAEESILPPEEADEETDVNADIADRENKELSEAKTETSEGLDAERMADMFKYLSELTDQTSGEGRNLLIKEGVPLKLAGLSAKLSGEPNLRVVAQKFDRRRRERHNVALSEEKIKDSLNAFKQLAESYPGGAISESFSRKLGSIMSFVGRKKASKDKEAPETNHDAEKESSKD